MVYMNIQKSHLLFITDRNKLCYQINTMEIDPHCEPQNHKPSWNKNNTSSK